MKEKMIILMGLIALLVLALVLSGCVRPPYCGDGVCTPATGENNANCPQDCPPTAEKATLIVEVFDVERVPLEGALVAVEKKPIPGVPGIGIEQHTDAEGMAKFELDADTYNITVSKKGYVPVTRTDSLIAGTITAHEFTLVKEEIEPASVLITVADERGVPIRYGKAALYLDGVFVVEDAEESGVMLFTGLKPGNYYAIASAPGYVTSDKVRFTLKAGDRQDWTINLTKEILAEARVRVSDSTIFGIGETLVVEGINAYAGRILTLTLAGIAETVTGKLQAIFQLTDERGSILGTKTVAAGQYLTFEDEFGREIIDKMHCDRIVIEPATQESTAAMSLEKRYTLNRGDAFTVRGAGAYARQLLTVTLTKFVLETATAAYQATFQLTDDVGRVVDTQTVGSGEYVYFEDWQGNPAVETTIYCDFVGIFVVYTSIKIGNNLIEYDDAAGTRHSMPMSISLPLSVSGTTFFFDTLEGFPAKVYWYEVDKQAGTIAFRYDHALGDLVGIFKTGDLIALRGGNDQSYNYKVFLLEVYNKVYLVLDNSTDFLVQHGKDILFEGTDATEDGSINLTYYSPDIIEFGQDSADNEFLVAKFTILEDGGSKILGYCDTRNGRLVTPNINLSYYKGQAEYDRKWLSDGTVTTAYGTKLSAQEGILIAEIPAK